MTVPIDRTAWSLPSQRSRGQYDEGATEYEGIACKCRRCESSFVLTPERQKIAYEVEKKYVWWIPSFCGRCQSEFQGLSERARSFQRQWNTSRSSLSSSETFLQEWLIVLQAISPYWGSNAMCVHVERVLADLKRMRTASLPAEHKRSDA